MQRRRSSASRTGGLEAYADLCGWALAEAHARSADLATISGSLGSGESFDRAIASFADLYADQNDQDYERLGQAAADGRVPVAPVMTRFRETACRR